MNTQPQSYEACARACHECQDACLRCSVHCLDMGGKHAARDHQTIMNDCASICAVTHDFLHRASLHATHLASECAEICTQCADSCERLAGGDEMMTKCVKACRDCAAACNSIKAR